MKTADMIEHTNEIPMKLHLFCGFIFGVISSVITDHLGDLALTFCLGVSSALGAGLVKLMTSWVKRLRDKDKTQNIREHDQESRDERQDIREINQDKRDENRQ